MLVVIAIIAVLVSIVIPTVSNSTEKAAEAADAANIRAYIAEASIAGLENPKSTYSKTYTLKQTGKFDHVKGDIGGYAASTFDNKTSVTIAWDADDNKVSVS